MTFPVAARADTIAQNYERQTQVVHSDVAANQGPCTTDNGTDYAIVKFWCDSACAQAATTQVAFYEGAWTDGVISNFHIQDVGSATVATGSCTAGGTNPNSPVLVTCTLDTPYTFTYSDSYTVRAGWGTATDASDGRCTTLGDPQEGIWAPSEAADALANPESLSDLDCPDDGGGNFKCAAWWRTYSASSGGGGGSCPDYATTTMELATGNYADAATALVEAVVIGLVAGGLLWALRSSLKH